MTQLLLNHLSVPVRDLDAAEALFVGALGFERVARHGDALATLTDGGGTTLVLSTITSARGDAVPYPEMFHLGFFVKDEAAVDEAHSALIGHADDPPDAPRRMRGRFGFYVFVLDGLLIEVSAKGIGDD